MKGYRRFDIVWLLTIVYLSMAIPMQAQFITEQTIKLDRALKVIDTYYVDSVNQDELVESAIIEVLKDLDPHSVYVSREEVKEMNEPLIGNFEGIGIQFNLLYDTIFVISPISGGPSEKVGIRAGDRIIKIEDEIVAGTGITNTGVRQRLLGKKGTKVNVSVKRKGMSGLLDFTIIRDKIPIFSLDASYMVNDHVGYVRFNRFSATTMKEFQVAVKELKSKGMKDLILDLRNNGGGILDAAVKISNEFLDDDKLIVYMEGNKVSRQEFTSDSRGLVKDGKVLVLVDQGSASASEIVSGAIQDWDRGLVIGRRTFGKGLVQRPYYLPDGSMIRLTIARYYTPSGRLIQKSYDSGFEAYMQDIAHRYVNGEFVSADSFNFPDSLKYSTLEKGRSVFGGGGIMPDIFVPLDTTVNFAYFNRLVSAGIVNNFILSYIDKNRETLEDDYESFDKYDQNFNISEEMIEDLLSMADKEEIERNPASFKSSYDQLLMVLKGLIARDLWSMSEYYDVVNKNDEVFRKAVEVMENGTLYDRTLSQR